MNYFFKLFILLFTQIFFGCEGLPETIEICGNTNVKEHGIDLTALDGTIWDLTPNKVNKERVDYSISICSPLNSSDKECIDSHICRHNKTDDKRIGYKPKHIELESITDSNIQSAIVLYEGPACDQYLNYTIKIRFICGPHLEYPKLFMDTKCGTELIWRTYAVCKEKSVQNVESKCYVYDNDGLRRDLTPLILPNGGAYKVLSQDQDFYINVCSDLTGRCSENDTGACLQTGQNSFVKVGDFRYHSIEFKTKSGAVAYDHIQMTYKTKSRSACSNVDANYTSITTIRFICPPKDQKRSIEFLDRNPKLVSNLDCDYQIDWMTEYACPLNTIEVPAAECELTEDVHGIDFNLKSLMKSSDYYKIENITINGTNNNTRYDIHFNVCGGIGKDCGDSVWKSNSVCLKSRENPSKDKVIGLTNAGSSLKLADNRFLLEYQTKNANCSYGDIGSITEKTLIEFVCDDTQGFEYLGKPEFISFSDCTYYIIWKTSLVCPVISAKTSCLTTYNNLTFDLSLLTKKFGAQPWTASVSQTLPWSRLAKDEKDSIYLNVCGVIPRTEKTESCDGRSSACMTVGDTNTSINLGHYTSAPKYNKDIKAIELVYDNGFDQRTNKKLKSKITLRCRPGSFNSEPTLVDVNEETGTYHFEWYTWAACPINPVVGTNCSVYDSFLDYTFDLSSLKSSLPYELKGDGYNFYISVCGHFTNSYCNAKNITTASGPFGVCQVETGGDKRAFSLGKANPNITYWNGIINMTYTDGTPYNNPEKTPRKSDIAFICDPNAGAGHPEYDGERNRSYFFRWYTSLVCPHTPKTVHCIWENGTHALDLTPLAMTTGNHFAVGLPNAGTGTTGPSIYYINICRPLNQIHDNHMSVKNCGADSAACRLFFDANSTVLSLGKATRPPFRGFDGSITLIYEDGSPCPSNNKIKISSRIKFECDPHSDLGSPMVFGPGSDLADNEECVYVFEWSTSAVCDIMEPTLIEANSCVFTDNITKLSADLTSLKKGPSEQPYKVGVRQNEATYELNICGVPNTQCSNSAVCYRTNAGSHSSNNLVSYGLLNSSTFFYDGTDLRLRFHNGSKCTAHNDTRLMSSEIIFKCNPEAKDTEPSLHSSHACVAVFEWETHLVCNLRPQKCSILDKNHSFYNLRQLSSLSHAWNTTDKEGNVYFLNVCSPLPADVKCKGVTSASCKCIHDSNNQLVCSQSLGDPSADELQVITNGTLLLTYKNGDETNCPPGVSAQTHIYFKCGQTVGNPKFVDFDQKKCVYKFKWDTMMACPVSNNNDILLPERNGFLHDMRLDIFIDVGPLLTQNFTAKELRPNSDNKTDEYNYIINMSSPPLSATTECLKSAVCQTKASTAFHRDIGTIDTIKYYLRGNELQIVLESTTKKCGRNSNKNVTTIFRLFCSSRSGVGRPVFMYESNDCDYTFNWETDRVCPINFVSQEIYTIMKDRTTARPEYIEPESSKSQSSSKVWIGIVIVVFFVVTLTVIFTYKQRVRQSLMFRFRRLFGPETTNHTFHYHQLASNEKDRQKEEVVFISQNDAQNRNTIAAQPSGPVPYYSIYDDSDVDLLT